MPPDLPRQSGTPPAEIAIDISSVSALLDEQHPDLGHLPLSLMDSGWDNMMFRLGDELLVRLPRRKAAANLVENEQRWLPSLAERLPLPIPVPYRVGKPTQIYPWSWSIIPYFVGNTADKEPLSANQTCVFISFLRALHQPAPTNAPENTVRGVPLGQRAAAVEQRMQRLAGRTEAITDNIRQVWQDALVAPIDVEAKWLHGDLHPRNILVNKGVLTGIIDWGDITSGDIATDLAAIWMLFPDQNTRVQALKEYGNLSPATHQRALGWAILFGVMLLDSGLVDNPVNAAIGAKTLQYVSEDEPAKLP